MKIFFDGRGVVEKPTITLCYPGCLKKKSENATVGTVAVSDTTEDYFLTRSVGVLNNISDLNFDLNFNEQWTVSFEYSYRTKDREYLSEGFYDENKITLCSAIEERMYLYISGFGFFVINTVTTTETDDMIKKNIFALSVDEELKNYQAPFFASKSYNFISTNTSEETIISNLSKCLGNWKLGYVDTSLYGITRYIENLDNKSVYSFLFDFVQKNYNCIVVPNYEDRALNIYTREHYLAEYKTSITLNKQNLINEAGIDSDASDCYTAVDARAQGDLSLSWINPMGNNILYNFSHYYSWMSPQLSAYLKSWKEYVDMLMGTKEHPGEYVTKNAVYLQAMTERVIAESELEKAQVEFNIASRDYNNLVNAGIGDLSESEWQRIKSSSRALVNSKEAALSEKKTLYESAVQDEATKKAAVDGIVASCQFKNWFASCIRNSALYFRKLMYSSDWYVENTVKDLYNELINYIYVCEYSDDNLIATESMTYQEMINEAFVLAENAKYKLGLVSSGIRKISLVADDFVFNKDFIKYTEQLVPGCIINCEVEEDDVEQLQCSSISLNFDDKKLSLTFVDKTKKYDIKTIFDEVLGSVSSTTANIASINDRLSTQEKVSSKQGVMIDSLNGGFKNQSDTLGAVEMGKISNGGGTTVYGLGGIPIYEKHAVLDWSKTYYKKNAGQYVVITQSQYQSGNSSDIYYYNADLGYLPVFDWGHTIYYTLSGASYTTITKSNYETNLARTIYYNKPSDYGVKLTKDNFIIGGFGLRYDGTPSIGGGTLISGGTYTYRKSGESTDRSSQMQLRDNSAAASRSVPSAIWVGETTGDYDPYFYASYEGKTYIKDGFGLFTNSSDRNVKNSIEPLDPRYEDMFYKLKPCRYKLNYETNGKYHTGFVAQDIKDSMDSSGISEEELSAFIDDKEPDSYTGARYRLAQDELIALCVNEIQKLKQKIKDLEER